MSVPHSSSTSLAFLKNAQTVGHALEAALLAYTTHPVYFGHGYADAMHEVNVLIQHVLSESRDCADAIARMFDSRDEAGLGLDAVAFEDETPLTEEQARRIDEHLCERLVKRRPLPYVLKEAWQGEFSFYVDERVLIPRSYIADLLFDGLAPWIAEDQRNLDILDLCCGSGCLGIIAAHVFPDVRRVTLSDISRDALAVAQINVNRYFIDQKRPRVSIVQSDVFDALRTERFDVILCNPPYVTTSSMATLPKEYRYEPALALAAGEDGLDIVQRILDEAPERLKPGGVLVVEIGNNQDLVQRRYPTAPFTWVDTPNSEGSVFITTREDLLAWR
jgi:ribosomal protein L3 glutamine methyltransferase